MNHAVSVCHGAFGRAALYEIDRPFVTHAHREGHLTFYVAGARGSMMVGDTFCHISPGEAVAVSPWEPHSFNVVDHSGPLLCLVLYIKPMWFLENHHSAEYALSFGMPVIRIDDTIRQWVTRLTSLLLDGNSQDYFDGILFETTRTCFEHSWRRAGQDGLLSRARSRFSDYRVRRSLRLMQEKFDCEVEVDEVAKAVGLSRPHFFKLFKKQMGLTPNIYLNTLRTEQAIDDLLTTNKTVTDIGYDLGFSSQASFTRFFGCNVGISPSEYRRVAHIS